MSYEDRDWNSQQYKSVRLACFKRDRFQCKYPNCKSKTKIQAHHIHKWSSHPDQRYLLSNLITLCRKHHDSIKDKEDDYIPLFTSLVNSSDILLDIIAARFSRKT